MSRNLLNSRIDGDKTRLIVGIKDSGDLNIPEEIAERHEAIIVSKISFKDKIKAIVVELPLISVSKFVEDARALGLISYIEPNMKVQVEFEPNDPIEDCSIPRKIGQTGHGMLHWAALQCLSLSLILE